MRGKEPSAGRFLVRPPFLRGERVHRVVHAMVVEPFGLWEDALEAEAEALRNGATAVIVGGGVDLDTSKAEVVESGVEKRSAGQGDEAPPLPLLAEPVAQARHTGLPVDRGEGSDAGQPLAAPR